MLTRMAYPGSFSKTLSKGYQSTTWIWDLHADAHDFETQSSGYGVLKSTTVTRKLLAVNIAHMAIVLVWLSGMLFHSAYSSNLMSWLVHPLSVIPSSGVLYSVLGQEILNQDLGLEYQGLPMTSGFYPLWLAHGIVSYGTLLGSSIWLLLLSISILILAFCQMHVCLLIISSWSYWFYCLCGLASLAWSGHLVDVSTPVNSMLCSGLDSVIMPSGADLLLAVHMPLSLCHGIESETASHHLYVSLVSIGIGFSRYNMSFDVRSHSNMSMESVQWHSFLSLSLGMVGSISLVHAQHMSSMPVYGYLSLDYPSVLCLYCHHTYIGVLLLVGCFAHLGIGLVRENSKRAHKLDIIFRVVYHRDLVLGHLIWLVLVLGFHSFGIYLHNDTILALGRSNDSFRDNGIQLKPVLSSNMPSFEANIIGQCVVRVTSKLGTADILVHHIHAFTSHTMLLILLKGLFYARSSRLVSDKLALGYRYPCDGPGRGGTCQISSWDHIYLGLFWMYNSSSVVLFHFFWKQQSDV